MLSRISEESSPQELKGYWFSAMRVIRKNNKNSIDVAKEILDKIESIEEKKSHNYPMHSVGVLKFTKHGHGFVSFGYDGDKCVVVIRKLEQHRNEGNRVYQVKVSGHNLPEHCRSIEEARIYGATEYESKA